MYNYKYHSKFHIRTFISPTRFVHKNKDDKNNNTNKKYFKRFDIPALKRCEIPLDRSDLSYSHEGATLIILYAKPRKVLYQEEQTRQGRKRAPKSDGMFS